MKTFEQKVAVITGAGSGIGQQFAIQLHRAGAHVALLDWNPTGLEETQQKLIAGGGRVTLHQVDVTQFDQMQASSQTILAAHGQVDMLINNAGVSLTPAPFEKIEDANFHKVIDINMWGVYHGMRCFLPALRQRPEASMVTISSLAGQLGLFGFAPYVMSKFAIRGLTETLQMELAGTHLHILAVYPGGVKTNLIKNAPGLSEPQREAAHQAFTQSAGLTAENAVRLILRAVQKKKTRLVIGWDARIVLVIRTLFPRRYPIILKEIFSHMNF